MFVNEVYFSPLIDMLFAFFMCDMSLVFFPAAPDNPSHGVDDEN